MRQDVGETLVHTRLELLRRASILGDLQAWATFQQGLEETVLSWLHEHPGSEAACRLPLSGCCRPLSTDRYPARHFPGYWCTCVRV
jgi:hypothetical protein